MEIKIYFQIPDFWAYPNLQHFTEFYRIFTRVEK